MPRSSGANALGAWVAGSQVPPRPHQAHLTLNRTAGREDSGTKAALTPTQLRIEEQICPKAEKACEEKADGLTLPFVGKAGVPHGTADTTRAQGSEGEEKNKGHQPCAHPRGSLPAPGPQGSAANWARAPSRPQARGPQRDLTDGSRSLCPVAPQHRLLQRQKAKEFKPQ